MSTNYYKEAIDVLNKLHKDHPTFSLGKHLSTALSDYGDIWSMSNKEMLFALEKYQAEMEFNSSNTSHEKYVDKIVQDAMNLDTILDGEDDEDDY